MSCIWTMCLQYNLRAAYQFGDLITHAQGAKIASMNQLFLIHAPPAFNMRDSGQCCVTYRWLGSKLFLLLIVSAVACGQDMVWWGCHFSNIFLADQIHDTNSWTGIVDLALSHVDLGLRPNFS